MLNKILSPLLLLVILSGCSATGLKFEELVPNSLNGKSELLIFRESKISASGSSFCTKINGESIGILKNGGFLRVEVEPGTHTVSMPFSEELSIELEAEPNKTKFVEFTVGLAGLGVLPIGTITSVSMSWNMALIATDEEYSVEKLSGLRESTASSDCEK